MQLNLSAVAVALATTDEVARFDTKEARILAIQIKNAGANPFDAFTLVGRVSDAAPDMTVASAALDYSTPNYPIMKTVGAPVTLAAGATGYVVIDCSAFSQMALKLSAGTGATTADINATTKA